jgi:hypothetical protein
MGLQPGPHARGESLYTRAEGGARAFAQWIAPPEKSPSDVLLTLTLSGPLLSVLSPPLENLGLRIEVGHIERYDGRMRHYNVITRGEQQLRILFYVKGEILANPSASNCDAMAGLPGGLQEGTTFLVLSDEEWEQRAHDEARARGEERIRFPAEAFQRLMNRIWPREKRVSASFVPWSELRKLETASTPQDQECILREILQLEELPQPARAAPPRPGMPPGEGHPRLDKALVAEIEGLVREDELADALDKLCDLQAHSDEATLLASRLRRTQNRERRGTLPRDEADAVYTTIAEAILDLLRE